MALKLRSYVICHVVTFLALIIYLVLLTSTLDC